MNNFTDLLGSDYRPDMEQRDYILHAAEADKVVVHEAAYLNDQASSINPHYDKDHVEGRRQLKETKTNKRVLGIQSKICSAAGRHRSRNV